MVPGWFFMVFRGLGWFQGSFMVFRDFWLVFGWFPWFFKVVSWFLVGSHGFQGGFIVFHGFWLVSMVFQGGFMVYHGFWLVSMVLLVENTTKLYPGPTIRSRPCQPAAGFGLVE